MSLHTLAKHVQEKGRGKDQMLVHMSPREVQGLQALAKAHGGSLTVNPETGLAEAGFLEQVLPIVAMAAATYFTAGAAAPALSAALAAEGMAVGTAATVGGALAGAGAGAGVGAIGAGLQGKDVGQGALYGGLGGAISGGMGAYGGGAEAAGGVSEAAQTGQAVEGVNQGAQLTDVTKQMVSGDAGAGAGVSPYGEANAIPNAGTAPGMPPTPPTAAGNAAAAQTGQARIDALNKLAEAQNAGVTSNAFGNAPGVNAEQSMYQAQNMANPSSAGNIYPDLKATPPPPGAEPSYYSTMGTPGKIMTQALPGVGADIGMNSVNPKMPGTEPYSSQATLSPDFQGYTPPRPNPYYKAQYSRYAAQGGLMSLAGGGPVEQMTQNMMGGQGNMYPQSQQEHTNFATPTQMPASAEVIRSDYDTKTNPYTGVMMSGGGDVNKKKQRAALTADRTLAAMSADQAGLAMLNNARYGANMTGASPLRSTTSLGDLPSPIGAARGGLADLGGYSDGGRLLKGPGDGMSDNIPAQIGHKQPARLADGEFVVPADVVSHLGNGSTDAGAKRLYAMMDRARQARTGKKKQAPAVNADKILSRVA